ncbi:MAG: hypothetical protein NDI61_11580 [Bdellovibrionaceae bacterium]|nr:hypothetical protein [Pseudobdellovibrionaceae bacterium]
MIAWILAVATALAVSPSYAETKSESKADAKKNAGKKSTSINFEDQLVEGQAQKPELFYLLQKKQFNYKRLIRLREDFLPEMRKTSEDISRKGSSN